MSGDEAFSEDEAVAGIRAGDGAAFERVFRAHHATLVRFADAQLRDRAAAEDVVHDVFLRIWRSRSELRIDRSLRAYLVAAVRHRVIDVARSRGSEHRALEFRGGTAELTLVERAADPGAAPAGGKGGASGGGLAGASGGDLAGASGGDLAGAPADGLAGAAAGGLAGGLGGLGGGATADPSKLAELAELDRAIRDAVAALPERCRTAFLLCREQDMTYAEAASAMGVSPATVKTHVARALSALRAALGPFLLLAAVTALPTLRSLL